MRQHASSVFRLLLVASAVASALPLAGCLIATAPPVPEPGLESVPSANVAAREGIVVAELRTIAQGEQFYFAEKGSFATLDELVEEGMLNHTPEVLGYTMELTVDDGGGGYTLEAVPEVYGPDGRRSFYLDEKGVIRGADHQGGAPEPSDPPVK
jgi:hypothetical protein